MSNTLNAVGQSALTAHGILVGEGTTTALTSLAVGTTGQVLLAQTGADAIWGSAPSPATSCKFVAYNAAAISNVTGDGTAYGPVVFGSVVVNTGTNYAVGTGVFTAPNTGWYAFSTAVRVTGLLPTHSTATLIFAGSVNSYTCQDINPGIAFDATSNLSLGGTIMIPMTAADTMSITVTVTGGTKVVSVTGEALTAVESYFMGYQVA